MRSIGKITPDILNIFHQEAAVEQKRWILTFSENSRGSGSPYFRTACSRASSHQSISLSRMAFSIDSRATPFWFSSGGYALAHSLYDHGWQESERQNGRHPDSDARSTSNHAVIIFRGGINVFRTVLLMTGADSFRRSSCSLWSRTARIRTARSSKRE